MTSPTRKKELIDGKPVSVRIQNPPHWDSFAEAFSGAIEDGLKFCDRLLKRRLQSEKEIRSKLYVKGFLNPEIKEILHRLKKEGLINDRRFTRFFIETYQQSRPYGKYALKNKLLKKGIDKELIEEELSRYFEENDGVSEAQELVERRFYRYKSLSKMEKIKKIDAYLYGRGYESDVIEEVFRRLKEKKLLEP